MTSVARKVQSGFPQKDLSPQGHLAGLKTATTDATKERSTRQAEKRRKDPHNTDRGDHLHPAGGAGDGALNGRPPSQVHGGPTGGHCGFDHKEDSETRPRLLDDVDMSEVKVQEDQLITEAGEFVCKICQIYVVGRTPKLTQCSHLFCGDCLAQWFSRHPLSDSHGRSGGGAQARVAPCPVCKTPLDEFKNVSALSSSSQAVLWRMLSSTKIICANNAKVRSDGTCEWQGCYSDYQKHIATCGHCTVTPTPPSAPEPTVNQSPPSTAPPTGGGCPPEAVVSGSFSKESMELKAALGMGGLGNQDVNLSAPAPVCGEAVRPPKGVHPMLATKAPAQTLTQGTLAQPPLPMGNSVTGPWQMHQACEVLGGTWEPSPAVTGLEINGAAANVGAPEHFSSTAAIRAPQQSWQPQLLGTGPPNQGSVSLLTGSTNSGIRATSAFDAVGPDTVQVRVGDYIKVLQNHSAGWAYCHNISTMSTGWAPSWVVMEEEFGASADFAQLQSLPACSRHVDLSEHAHQLQWQMHFEQSRPNYAGNMPASCPVTEVAHGQKSCDVKEVKVAFSGVGPSQLSLAPGELVEVFDRDTSGWTYGRKVLRSTSPCMPVEGWFPDWACGLGALRPTPAAPWVTAWS